MSKNKVLGKGLSALIQGADLSGVNYPIPPEDTIRKISLADIAFNPDQPRKHFDDKSLSELSDSIKQVGILQPVLLRQDPGGSSVYCVVAGERRIRAAQRAGLVEVPAIICTYKETEALKVALLENIQREDLGPLEEARAYHNLMESYGATQEELADMLGKNRSTVANTLRLLGLEQDILNLLQNGKISRGHGKALLGMPPGPGRIQLAKMCSSRGLSVRDCERRVKVGGGKPRRRKRAQAKGAIDPALRALVKRTEQIFGSPVSIDRDPRGAKGTLSMRFYSDEDLIRLLKIMGVDTQL